MTQFLLHFFPLLTIFTFGLAGVLFVLYMGSIRKIEQHMASQRPEEWKELGKPSVFSKMSSEKRLRFREFLDNENADDVRDAVIEELWTRSKSIKKLLTRATVAAFGLYIFTIIAVKVLIESLTG